MVGMTERIPPTVITSNRKFGSLLLILRTFAAWSQVQAGREYRCSPALVGLRERGLRAMTVGQGVQAVDRHGYVLVLMHGEDATRLHRLRPMLPEVGCGRAHVDDAPARHVG